MGGIRDNKEENWQVGADLITGSDDPTSGNDIWNEARLFETGDTRLDYAYAKHRWDDVSMTLGQHKTSYKTS
ncbi:MAG: hypothetical protein K0A99_05770 [Desulfoarculaceae bacterium]|nr:hypothetical protein [Desulfoarculaceae bacterium]